MNPEIEKYLISVARSKVEDVASEFPSSEHWDQILMDGLQRAEESRIRGAQALLDRWGIEWREKK